MTDHFKISPSKVERAREAIDLLSSLSTSSTASLSSSGNGNSSSCSNEGKPFLSVLVT